ncbi:RNA polymerase sigma factor [Flavobacterium litorale]|uniref:RNA polymerase sigma factor n=1 Tax=Flavobacterium litorale TaxID=2856519 RepID=A0ABX8V3L4_9FLAO|nr:RNA polymerase sigma factor [Flavobacterium litorale]QYJ67385.1 RNA polymerase sigma factor [Flavobacterium litorale]
MPRRKARLTSEIIKEFGVQLSIFITGRVHQNQDAQDILQDVWYQLSRLTNMDEVENIGAWLYRVARNKITDLYRKQTNDLLEDYTYEAEDGTIEIRDILLLDTTNDPELALYKKAFWEALLIALNELPALQREVFVLNEIDGVTLKEIADRQQENIKTIISRKGYAVKHLRKKLHYLHNDLNKH